VSYETIRRWVSAFGPMVARGLRAQRPEPHRRWHLDGPDRWQADVRLARRRCRGWGARGVGSGRAGRVGVSGIPC